MNEFEQRKQKRVKRLSAKRKHRQKALKMQQRKPMSDEAIKAQQKITLDIHLAKVKSAQEKLRKKFEDGKILFRKAANGAISVLKIGSPPKNVQGEQEKARRRRQIEKGMIQTHLVYDLEPMENAA